MTNRSIIIGERNDTPQPTLLAHLGDKNKAKELFDGLEVGNKPTQFKWLELHRIGKGRGKRQEDAVDFVKGVK